MRAAVVLLLLGGLGGAARGEDPETFEQLVRRAVKDDGVDYELLRGTHARQVIAGVASGSTTADRINYYNAAVLKGVVEGKTPKEACKVLDGFEFDDPRIHFALHRAARGSPKLQFYRQSTLHEDLTQAIRVFLMDERNNEFDDARLEARLSELFYIHRADLVSTVKEKSFQVFLANHAPRASLGRRLLSSHWTIRYKSFDWTLNQSGVPEDEAEEEGGSPMLWLYLIPAALLVAYGAYTFRALIRRRSGTSPAPKT